MRLRVKKEHLFLGISGLATLVGLFLFFRSGDSSRDGNKQGLTVANVVKHINMVRKKEINGLAWLDIEDRKDLHLGEQIFTHEESYATIEFIDGALINMAPSTLLKIGEGSDELDVDLEKGFLGLDFNKSGKEMNLKVGDRAIKITSSNAIIRIARKNSESIPELFLVSGEAKIKSGDETLKAEKGDQVDFPASQAKPRKTKVSITPKLPSGDAKVFVKPGQSINFEWESTEALQEYELIVARDEDFGEIVLQKKMADNRYSAQDLPDGVFYWKVAAVHDGKKLRSPVYNFLHTIMLPPVLTEPAEGHITKMVSQEEMGSALLRWQNKNAETYEIELTGAGGKPKMYKSAKPEFQVNKIPGGNYSWKVRGIFDDTGKQLSDWSKLATFSVMDKIPFAIIRPKKGEEIFNQDKVSPVVFEWQGDTDMEFKLEVANDPKFSDIVYENSLKGTRHTWNKPTVGRYYWRLTTEDRDTDTFVADNHFDLTLDFIKIVYPAEGESITMNTPGQEIPFKWKGSGRGLASEPVFVLEISPTETFEKIIYTEESDATSTSLGINAPGKYFWRVRVEEEGQTFLKTSKAASFTITPAPKPEPPPLPEEMVLVPDQDNPQNMDYNLEWKSSPNVKQYVLEIFRDESMTKLLTTLVVKKPSAKISGNLHGMYYIRVKARDHWERESEFSRTCKVVAPIAPLYFPKEKH